MTSPISLTRLDPTGADREQLLEFMTTNEFPFHVVPRPTRAQVEEWIGEGAYRDEDNDSFWVDHDELGRIGFLRLEDLSDPDPVFDLRLGERFRGRGLGVEALRAVTAHVYTTMPERNRFEGQTREDNIAMRRVFLRCGFVKEAHYREGWPVDGGPPVASVAYGILRRDWETGTVTPFVWEDLVG
jgi:RimJ/RimL family protein N-acetyltransferase